MNTCRVGARGSFVSLKSWILVHRVKVALVVLVCALLVSAAFASTFFRSSQAGPTVTLVSPPFEFSMAMDKTEFQLGENITVKFSLRNLSNQTIHVVMSEPVYYSETLPPMLFDFIVTAENGTEVFRWGGDTVHLSSQDEVVIQPGEEINMTSFWDQKIYPDYLPPGPMSNRVLVPPGIYYVRGAIPPGRGTVSFRIDSGPRIRLETASISFTIG